MRQSHVVGTGETWGFIWMARPRKQKKKLCSCPVPAPWPFVEPVDAYVACWALSGVRGSGLKTPPAPLAARTHGWSVSPLCRRPGPLRVVQHRLHGSVQAFGSGMSYLCSGAGVHLHLRRPRTMTRPLSQLRQGQPLEKDWATRRYRLHLHLSGPGKRGGAGGKSSRKLSLRHAGRAAKQRRRRHLLSSQPEHETESGHPCRSGQAHKHGLLTRARAFQRDVICCRHHHRTANSRAPASSVGR